EQVGEQQQEDHRLKGHVDQRLRGPEGLDQTAPCKGGAVPHQGDDRAAGRSVEVGVRGNDGGHTSSLRRTAAAAPGPALREVRVWKTSSRLGSARASSVTSMPASARAAATPASTASPITGTEAAPGREAAPVSVEAVVPDAATTS